MAAVSSMPVKKKSPQFYQYEAMHMKFFFANNFKLSIMNTENVLFKILICIERSLVLAFKVPIA